ncbi:MAG: hypothetical protein AVDCRST_MAG93-2477 [uncultured Chloroflexia bacterium]|uniref:Uncharacterized protein n=1 Tax=uncultured Chloroflexia bacterium TaxID=1672391 RepID=A0A6J4J3J1_9CHLR|nr:MAG: hypothetical protein AVDCRST_MAG93-2477 [uncultured Chloroflexia bacterium]
MAVNGIEEDAMTTKDNILKLMSRIAILEQRVMVHFGIFSLWSAVAEKRDPAAFEEFHRILSHHRDEEAERAVEDDTEAKLKHLVRINELDQMLEVMNRRQTPTLRVVDKDDPASSS